MSAKIRPRIRASLLGLALLAAIYLLGGPTPALAFSVDPLPEGNQIDNPWFFAAGNPDKKSLEGWVDEQGLWGVSQKKPNPSPFVERGTAARFAGPGPKDGVDAYLYTIIAADPSERMLKFKTHWVSANIEIAEAIIYGGTSAEGPWEPVWTPLSITAETDAHFQWQETDLSAMELPQGFPFYKIEYHARYRVGEKWGFKFTGVYFSTGIAAGVTVEPSATPSAAPVSEPTPSPEIEPEPTAPAPSVRRRPKPASGGIFKDRN